MGDYGKPKSKYKICSCCGKQKKINQFHRDPNSSDGYRTECRSCRSVNITSEYPFFTQQILQLCKNHKYVEVTYFGYFLGIMVYLRPKEILAFSVVAATVKGSNVFETHIKAREWLCKKVIQAGERIAAGLTRKMKG